MRLHTSWDSAWKRNNYRENSNGDGSSLVDDDEEEEAELTPEELAKAEREMWVGKLDELRASPGKEYDAYFRMLEFGVQIEAVLIKMQVQ
jgi:hypothetical protein